VFRELASTAIPSPIEGRIKLSEAGPVMKKESSAIAGL
jgi:hypothetical protein